MKIEWTKTAYKDLFNLPKETRRKIYEEIIHLPKGNVKKLKGKWRDFFRLRVGNYRIIFKRSGINSIIVYKIRYRQNAYK